MSVTIILTCYYFPWCLCDLALWRFKNKSFLHCLVLLGREGPHGVSIHPWCGPISSCQTATRSSWSTGEAFARAPKCGDMSVILSEVPTDCSYNTWAGSHTAWKRSWSCSRKSKTHFKHTSVQRVTFKSVFEERKFELPYSRFPWKGSLGAYLHIQ